MKSQQKKPIEIDPAERQRRHRYLIATLVTCLTLAMLFGTAHVVKLGSNRMEDMRSKASYDLKDEHKHIRAAGEDIQAHRVHEEQSNASNTYELAEVQNMITAEKWLEIEIMVLIPAGETVIGTNSERADIQDQPQHMVNLPGYYIDKYPVTNVQYAKFVATTNHRPPLDWELGKIPDKKNLHPVVMVSWYDAQAYCEHAGKRLPTEIEWEKAARGKDGKRWPWGDTMLPTNLNTYYNVGSTTLVTRYTQGQSSYGVFDMAGNVSEWTASDFIPYAGSSAPATLFKPKMMTESTNPLDRAMKVADLKTVEGVIYKVRRGGSWKSDPFASSAYHRNFSMPHYASDFFGFRCAKDS